MTIAMSRARLRRALRRLRPGPRRRRRRHPFLDPVFADSPLTRDPALGRRRVFGLAIGGAISVARHRHRLLPLRRAAGAAGGCSSALRPLHTFLDNKWYFDEPIDVLVVRPALALGRFANRLFERYVVHGLVSGTARSSAAPARAVRAVQSGYLRSYALLLVAGFAGLALYFLVRLVRSP